MGPLATELSHRIREIADVQTDEPIVVSMYLSLDPSRFATAKNRESEIESLIDDVRAQAAEKKLSHDAEAKLAADIERVKTFAKESSARAGAQGLAVFCCSSADLFDVFRLSAPVGPEVHVGPTARLETLTTALPTEAWGVFLINRRVSRIFRGSPDHLIAVDRTEDDVHGKHDQGGWSQANYQRSIEKEVSDHVQSACDGLFDAFQRLPFDKLLVGCPEELWPDVKSKLHHYLTDRVVDRFDAEVEHSNPDEVLERARPFMEQEMRREEAGLIERLSEQLGRAERATAGLSSVLEALNASRVDVLLMADGYEAEGVICPQCGWLGVQGKECPADGTRLDRSENVVASAVRSAMLQASAVHPVRYHEPERAIGGYIAALLRY